MGVSGTLSPERKRQKTGGSCPTLTNPGLFRAGLVRILRAMSYGASYRR
jgi:hypothetical protein